MNPPLSVLVVSADRDTGKLWCLLLSEWGHRPILAYDAAAVWAVALAEKPEVVPSPV
jgi:hypothetical protein